MAKLRFFILFRCVFYFFIMLLFSSSIQTINYEFRIGQLINAYADKVEKERGYQLISIGGGMPTDITDFSLRFRVPFEANTDKARTAFIEVLEEFKNLVNNDYLVRPALEEFPFEIDRIMLTLFFMEDGNKVSFEDKIKFVSHYKDQVFYCKFYEFNHSGTEINETYEDALRIVKEQGNEKISDSNLQALAKEVLAKAKFSKAEAKKYSGPKEYKRAYYAVDDFGKQIASKYNMKMLYIGEEGLVGGKKTKWSLNWINQEKVTQEKIRPTILAIHDAFWEEVKQNPAYRITLCMDYNEDLKTDTNVNPEQIGFKITFWDENVNRQQAPYLAQVRLVDGNFKYYYADPITQALQEPIVESVEETRRFLNK